MRDPYDHNDADFDRKPVFTDVLEVRDPRVIQMAGAPPPPDVLNVTDRRAMRSIDPGLGFIKVEQPVRPNVRMKAYDPRVSYQASKVLGFNPRPNLMVDPVREMRRAGTELSGLGETDEVAFRDDELLDLLRLSSLQSILYVGMDRFSSAMMGSTKYGQQLETMARQATSDAEASAARNFAVKLADVRTSILAFRKRAHSAFEASDEIAKLLQTRGYSTKWFNVVVRESADPNVVPTDDLVRAERKAAVAGRVIDYQDAFVVRGFRENSDDFSRTMKRVDAALARVGIPHEVLGGALGIGPVIAAVIWGCVVIVVAIIGAVTFLKAEDRVLSWLGPEAARAVTEMMNGAGQGISIAIPLIAGIGALAAAGLVFSLAQ